MVELGGCGVHSLESLVYQICRARAQTSNRRSLLVGISGIDRTGNRHVVQQLAREVEAVGYRVAVVDADGWMNLPEVRACADKPAEHFYHYALRFDELFSQLVLPLRDRRSLSLDAEVADEASTTFQRRRYEFENIDVILLHGMFLFKWEFFPYYDLSIWVECSFETALQRVIRTEAPLGRDFNTVYFPAQRLHFTRDNPKSAATFVYESEPRALLSFAEVERPREWVGAQALDPSRLAAVNAPCA